ncbi:hypothetical protein FKM82_025561 [Ascaphus truei]
MRSVSGRGAVSLSAPAAPAQRAPPAPGQHGAQTDPEGADGLAEGSPRSVLRRPCGRGLYVN